MDSLSRHRAQRRALWLVAAGLSCSVTLTNQMWVGRMSIYASDQELKRERLHYAFLNNRLPDGVESWSSIGANGMNIRLLTVWTAEGLHRVTGLTLAHSYFLIETCALFLCCVLLFGFLESCAGTAFAFAGLLYFGCVLPLTYVLHYFHPWDKPSLAAWLLALICTQQRRWVYLALVLAIGVFIKYDILVFPLFVLLAEFHRSNWRETGLLVGLLTAVTLSIYIFLQWLAPGGVEPRDWMSLSARNLRDIWNYAPGYPPLLGLGIPAVLAALGYPTANQFARAGVQFSIVVALILFLQTNFREFRAETPVLVLLLPAAAFGIERLTGGVWKTSGTRPVELAQAASPERVL
jgi:hypothetical protein